MTPYTAWRISYQDAEQAARAAFDRVGELSVEVNAIKMAYEEACMEASRAEAEIRRLKKFIHGDHGDG